MTRVYGCILRSPRNAVLLVQGRVSGKWSFPKGHAYADENPLTCARRETYEETGLTPSPFCVSKIHLSKGTYFMYNVSLEANAKPRDTNEVSATKWVSVHDIPKYPCNIDVNNFYRRTTDSSAQNTQRDTVFPNRCVLPRPYVMPF